MSYFISIIIMNNDCTRLVKSNVLHFKPLSIRILSYIKVISESECIPVTPHGSKTRPAFQLVDPTSFLGPLYLPIDERFPYGQTTYAGPDVLPVLRALGMKHEMVHISWDDILERAQAVAGSELHRACARQLVVGLLAVMAQKLADGDTICNHKAIRLRFTFLCILCSPI